MMALSKCVLDRVEERKNELKGRMYGLVEIMSRSVFARMQKRTSLYKDLLDQLVEQVFNKFTQQLNEAWRDGCAHGRDLELSLNQHISNDEEYGLDSKIDNDSLSMSTFESQTSSSEQSLDDDADDDDEEYYSIMAPKDGVDQCVLDRVEERKNNFKIRAYGLVEIISRTVFARMVKRTSVYKDLLDQLVEQVFNMFTQELNDAWRDGCDYGRDEWNVYSDFDDLFEDQPEINYLDLIEPLPSQQQSSPLHSNEDSSLHSSQTLSQPSSQSQLQNIIQHEEQVSDSEFMTESVPISSSLFKTSPLQEFKIYEELDDGEYNDGICEEMMDNVQNEEQSEELVIDDQTENQSKLSVVNGQIDGDEENDEVGEECDDDESEVKDMDQDRQVEETIDNGQNEEFNKVCETDTQTNGNNSHLSVVNGQMDGVMSGKQDGNEELAVNELSGLVKTTFSPNQQLLPPLHPNEDQLVQNVPSGQVAVPDKLPPTGKSTCEHCGKVFKKRSNFTRHIRTHTGERPFKCPKCFQAFSHKTSMQSHLVTQHDKSIVRIISKPFLCTWQNCRKTFSEKHHLKKHMFIHTGERHYKCPWKDCNMAFIHSQQRFIHFKVHTDDQPFECPWEDCHDEFVGIRHFRVHITRVHHEYFEYGDEQLNGLVHRESIKLPKEKHICGHCGKSLSSRSKLTRHIRTHSHEKPFKCGWNNCKWAFAQKCDRDRHYKKQHSTVLSNMKTNGMTNSVLIVTTSSSQPQQSPPLQPIEINNQEYDEEECFSQFIEDTLQLSATLSKPTPPQSIQNNNYQQSVSESEIVTESWPISSTLSQLSSQSHPHENSSYEIKGKRRISSDVEKMSDDRMPEKRIRIEETEDEERREVILNNGIEDLFEEYDRDQIIANNQNLSLVNGQMDAFGNNDVNDIDEQQTGNNAEMLMASDDDHGNEHDQLNGSNIVETDANEGQFSQIVPIDRIVVTDTPTGNKHVCAHCGKVSRKASELANHIRTHTGEKPLKCPWSNCSRTFAHKSNLNYHLKFHNNEYPYVCTLCTRRFRLSSELKVHTRTHTGERPFRCPLDSCNMTFARIGSMKLHHMSHSGQFPHVCDHCAVSFRTPDRLKVHIRTHTGERPFQCTWKDCAKRFRAERYLTKHYRTHGSTIVHSIQSVPRDK